MADWLLLGLVAFGFYLYECCTWTPATVFACHRKPLRRGEPHAAHHSPRDALQLVIDRPHHPDELEDRVRSARA